MAARFKIERIASFSPFLHHDPSDYRLGIGDCKVPEVAVAFVQEVADVEPLRGQVVHVVSQRAHAHHDRLSIAMRHEIGRDDLSALAIHRVTL